MGTCLFVAFTVINFIVLAAAAAAATESSTDAAQLWSRNRNQCSTLSAFLQPLPAPHCLHGNDRRVSTQAQQGSVSH